MKMDIVTQLQALEKKYCTGPCGQSSSVLAQRTQTSKILKEAMAEIDALRREIKLLQKEIEKPCVHEIAKKWIKDTTPDW